jgi:hypothetical protein
LEFPYLTAFACIDGVEEMIVAAHIHNAVCNNWRLEDGSAGFEFPKDVIDVLWCGASVYSRVCQIPAKHCTALSKRTYSTQEYCGED